MSMTCLSTLDESLWATILSYLKPDDMQCLLLVNRSIKEKVQQHLYHELTLTEWASSGARLALAIDRGIVSDETCECVETLKIQFTSIEEISEALRLSLEIQPRMPNIQSIDIEAHKTEDALAVVGILVQKYRNCSSITVVARAPIESPLGMARSALPLITALRVPRLFRHETSLLSRITELELEEVIEDGSSSLLTKTKDHVFDRLSIPYSSYKDLGSPTCTQLELRIDVNDTDIVVNDSACTVLKLVATEDLPQIIPKFHTPSLRALILCNLAPLPTIRLLEANNLDTVEFLSIAPVTLPALQALANKASLPALRLLLVLVSRASFLSDSQFLHKRETRRLVEWLQMLAAQYPVDVRDFSWLLRQDIYFSDGLWCLAAQTRYRKYLPLVAPPPLKSQ